MQFYTGFVFNTLSDYIFQAYSGNFVHRYLYLSPLSLLFKKKNFYRSDRRLFYLSEKYPKMERKLLVRLMPTDKEMIFKVDF